MTGPTFSTDAFLQYARNGRWGTCVDCPRDNLGASYPEFCAYTERRDHQLTIGDLEFQERRHQRDLGL